MNRDAGLGSWRNRCLAVSRFQDDPELPGRPAIVGRVRIGPDRDRVRTVRRLDTIGNGGPLCAPPARGSARRHAAAATMIASARRFIRPVPFLSSPWAARVSTGARSARTTTSTIQGAPARSRPGGMIAIGDPRDEQDRTERPEQDGTDLKRKHQTGTHPEPSPVGLSHDRSPDQIDSGAPGHRNERPDASQKVKRVMGKPDAHAKRDQRVRVADGDAAERSRWDPAASPRVSHAAAAHRPSGRMPEPDDEQQRDDQPRTSCASQSRSTALCA